MASMLGRSNGVKYTLYKHSINKYNIYRYTFVYTHRHYSDTSSFRRCTCTIHSIKRAQPCHAAIWWPTGKLLMFSFFWSTIWSAARIAFLLGSTSPLSIMCLEDSGSSLPLPPLWSRTQCQDEWPWCCVRMFAGILPRDSSFVKDSPRISMYILYITYLVYIERKSKTCIRITPKKRKSWRQGIGHLPTRRAGQDTSRSDAVSRSDCQLVSQRACWPGWKPPMHRAEAIVECMKRVHSCRTNDKATTRT